MDEATQTLCRCLRQHLMLAAGEEVDLSADLVSLGLDSMTAIALVLDLEQAFAVRFPNGMLEPRTFRTGQTLLAAIRELGAAGAGRSSSASAQGR